MSGGTQSNPQGFPQTNAPFVDERKYITPQWLYLLQALWLRTGAGAGSAVSPTGMLAGFAAATPPSGWAICDGSAISRSTYSALFAVIGTTWGGGDGSTTFNLPNFRGRALIGVSGSHALASTGGAESVTLSVGQLPAHSHTVTDPGHVHASVVAASTNTAGAAAGAVTAGSTSSATTGITLGNTGSGDAVPTISPFAAAVWMIKL